MKKLTLTLSLLTAGLGITVELFANDTAIPSRSTTANSLLATNYILNAEFTNNPVVPNIASVSDIPQSTNFFSAESVSFTDGAGKIEGVSDLGWGVLSHLGPFVQGDVIANVSGSISTVKSNTVVTMTMKGKGFAMDAIGSNQANASLSLSFKSTKGIVMVTNEFDKSVGPAIVLTTNPDGSTSSNFLAVVIQTNLTINPNYNQLVFTVATSDILTNSGTEVTVSNAIDSADNVFPFGNTISTNGQQRFTVGHVTFTNAVIAYVITWDSSQTAQPVTNAILGLDASAVPSFITNFFAVNTFTNSRPRERFVQTVMSVQTNVTAITVGTNGFPGGFTNLTVVNNLSNSWFEIDGFLNGSVHAGKFSQAIKNEPATLTQNHVLFSAFQGTGSNTTLQAQFGPTSGQLPVPTNDNGLWYVAEQPVFSDSLSVTPFTYFSSDVKQSGANMWFSAPQGDSHISVGFFGTGSLNSKQKTYKATLNGVSFSHGTTYKLSGNTGPLTVAFTPLVNVVTLTNTAAAQNLDAAGFGTNLDFEAFSNFATNSGVTTTNFTFISTDTVVLNGVTNNVQNALNGVPIAPSVATNTIPNGITTVVLSGKVQGQAIGPINGTNASVPVPQ